MRRPRGDNRVRADWPPHGPVGRRFLGQLPPLHTAEFLYRRGGLLGLLGFGAVVSAITLSMQARWGFDPSEQLGLGIIIVKNLLFMAWLWRSPRHFLAIGLTELALAMISGLYRLFVTLHSPASFSGLGGYVPWMVVTYVTAFLVLPPRAALAASLTQFGGLLAIGLGYAADPRIDAAMKTALGNSLLQTYLVHATFIGFLSLQQWLQQHYVQALLSARQEASLAHVDALTGLPNRRQLQGWLGGAALPYSVVLFDLDHFKRVNDTYGHDLGDQTLQHVARVLRRTVRQRDLVGRWGGEEFLILVSGAAHDAAAVAERVRDALHLSPHAQVGPVTISCGVAQAAPGESPDEVLRRADEALYRAKRAGRDTVMVAA